MNMGRSELFLHARQLFGISVTALAVFSATQASAVAPPAGFVIGNQASASYVDGNNTSHTSTSNTVNSVVSQIAGDTLTASQNKTSTPGSTVYFQHVITNTGNGSDSYNLTTVETGGGFAFAGSPTIYPDVGCNGTPSSATPITVTPTLTSGQSYCVVVAATVPTTATSGSTDGLTITSKSAFNPAYAAQVNSDSVKVTSNAVINVVKSETVTSGAPGTSPITVSLTYTNTGNATATAVKLTDALPAGMTYIAGTGRWSASGAATLTDASDGNEQASFNGGIDYSETGTTVTATVANVASGSSGVLTFQVAIAAGTAPGLLPNTAALSYNDGSGTTVTGNSNTVNFTVLSVPSVTISDKVGTTSSTTDGDGAANNIVTVNAAAQGATVTFDNVLQNTGNGTDSFNITTSGSGFPAGTTFQVFKADGVTPMTDSNGDSIVDTGPVAPGAITHVIIKATLPASATGAGPYNVSVTATSTTTSSAASTTTDRLLAITGSSVDITNNGAGTGNPGFGPGPEAAPQVSVSVNPGSTGSLVLVITNTGATTDNYDLTTSTDKTFAALNLPAGWTVQLRRASDGTTISNTGSLAPGASITINAIVSVPAGQTPLATPGQSIYFRALSPNTGSVDRINDSVIVNTVTDLAVSPNNSATAFPGGSVTYVHTLTNNGNVAVSADALTVADSASGYTSVIYYDANNNGVIDATDPVISNINQIPGGLAPGASVKLLVKVFVPSGATAGSQDTTTLTVATLSGETITNNNSATDQTSVVTGTVQVSKLQAADTNCNGTLGAFTAAQLSAAPGTCLAYKVTATNTGSTTVTSAIVSDATPSSTTYANCGGTCAATESDGNTPSTPAVGSTGTVSTVSTSLPPATSLTLQFEVQINQ